MTRGDVVVTGVWRPTSAVDAEIELVAEAPRPLAHRTRVRVHHGTGSPGAGRHQHADRAR
ncbi:MAG: hypothetical protein R2882_05320 [Gemmatimonadales bacterium]